jgi:toxin ParE1/3/4
MNVVYAPRALRDIDEILAYIQQRSSRSAANVSLAIEQAVMLSAQVPRAAGKTDLPNHYRRPLVRYPYTLFYSVDATRNDIEILRVIHSARVKNLGSLPADD